MMSKKVAVVGGGVSGISSFWALDQHVQEIHLYEASAQLGGHANTAEFEGWNGEKAMVDTGFIALNKRCYRKSI